MNDYEVKPLNEYPKWELEELLDCVNITLRSGLLSAREKEAFTKWCYRLNEALKMQRKETI